MPLKIKKKAEIDAEEQVEAEKKAKRDALALTLANLDPATVKLSELAQLIKDLHGEG